MTQEKLEQYLSGLKGSESSYPFGPEALVFKVTGKMFALVAQKEDIPKVTLKCAPADAEMLCSEFDSIVPGYHMNKKHWITVSLTGELEGEMLSNLVDDSYHLVVSKLTKVEQKALEQLK